MSATRRYAFAISATLLIGCGGASQPPLAGPNQVSQVVAAAQPNLSYRVIHSFKDTAKDGALPLAEAPLVVSHDLLYGTTSEGGSQGASCGDFGCGTFFSASQLGAEHPTYAFDGEPNGASPSGPPILFHGKWYGVTGNGGTYDKGAVYEVDSSGREHIVYSFRGGHDGFAPFGALIAYNGLLYGTTSGGGKHNLGTVYAVTPSGNEFILHSFGFGFDGEFPYEGLTLLDRNLYGTTVSGGADNFGTVFSISPLGKERIVYSFQYGNDGASPQAPLLALGGELYGTTTDGGGRGYLGTAFAVSTSGRERILHRFQESFNDGYFPQSGLLYLNGTFYGTTSEGGHSDNGIVFSLTPSGRERILHNFAGAPDGTYPVGGLVAIQNALYGMTSEGGKGPCYGGQGCGTIFALTP